MIQIKNCVIHITNFTLHFTKRFEIQDCNFVLVAVSYTHLTLPTKA